MKFHLMENGFRTKVGYGELVISANDDNGYRPSQLMVASIVGCSGTIFRNILEKQRTEVEDLLITAEVERNPEEANRIERIALNYAVKGRHLDPDKLYKNLALSRKNCAMIRSVEDSITIEETIDIIELST